VILRSEPPATGWDCHVHVFAGRAAADGAHYTPVPRPLAEIEALAQLHGCRHLVLVQPSVYGSDNAVLLAALHAGRGRHRGVVVLDGDESDATLDAMHDLGVRGVRLNLVSPVGSERNDAPALLERLAPGLRRRGWHVQWYATPADLPQLARWQVEHRLPFVLDHLAGMSCGHRDDAAAWAALEQLAGAGGWVKLSGWYRLGAQPPYGALQPLVRRVAEVFGGRLVWGSDWPHTSFSPQELPPYASLWQPVVRALGEESAQRVREAGARLYA
jgi:predicted TIM-barrel fold metal-dependent hydrolase